MWRQDHSMEVGTGLRSYLLEKIETPVFPKLVIISNVVGGNKITARRWEQASVLIFSCRLQHKGALLHTPPTQFSQNWSSFQEGWRLSKQPQNPFCSLQPPCDGTKLFKNWSKNFLSSIFWRDRASHTLSRELSATVENYCSSTLFDYISKFGRICTDKMCAYICICKNKILAFVFAYIWNEYLHFEDPRKRDSQVRGM